MHCARVRSVGGSRSAVDTMSKSKRGEYGEKLLQEPCEAELVGEASAPDCRPPPFNPSLASAACQDDFVPAAHAGGPR